MISFFSAWSSSGDGSSQENLAISIPDTSMLGGAYESEYTKLWALIFSQVALSQVYREKVSENHTFKG